MALIMWNMVGLADWISHVPHILISYSILYQIYYLIYEAIVFLHVYRGCFGSSIQTCGFQRQMQGGKEYGPFSINSDKDWYATSFILFKLCAYIVFFVIMCISNLTSWIYCLFFLRNGFTIDMNITLIIIATMNINMRVPALLFLISRIRKYTWLS